MITILTTYQVSDTWYIRTWYQVYIYRTRVYDSRYVLTRYVRGINERIGILYNSQHCTTSGAHACIAVQDYTAVDKNVKGRRWWTALGLGRAVPGRPIFHLVGRGPARPIKFSKDGAWPGPAHHLFIFSRPGPAHDIGGEAHETRALYGPAHHFRGPARGFNGPGHGRSHE